MDTGILEAHITDHMGSDGVPLYLRVAMSLRTRIYRGEWQKGDKLPPFEILSQHYGVAMNTVANFSGSYLRTLLRHLMSKVRQ